MTVPTTKVYVWFDFPFQPTAFTLDDTTRGLLDNVTYPLYASTRTDVTAYVNSTVIRRGNQSQLFPDSNAGTCVIQLNNESRLFDPQNSASTYFGNIIPGRRVDVETNGVLIFSGRIQDWDFTYDVSGRSVAVMNCADGMAILARQEFDDWTPTASQLTGARISAVLDRAEVQWPYARDLDTGVATLSGTAVSFSTNVLGYLNTVNKSEPGLLYVARDGVLTFKDRHATLNTTTDLTFSDQSTVTTLPQSYLSLPGVAGAYASTPDSAALDVTGDLELVVRVAADDWTVGVSSQRILMAKYNAAGSNSWFLSARSGGNFDFTHSANGTVDISGISDFINFINGTTYWIKVTLDVDDGAGNHVKRFYYAFDQETEPTTWRLASTVTTAGTTSVFAGTSVLEIGSLATGTLQNLAGKVYRAIVRNGIGGTTVFDANFSTSLTAAGQTSFTESSSNAATVTINGGASAFYVAAGAWNGKVPYQTIGTTYGSETLYNRIGVQADGLGSVTLLSLASQQIYGIASLTTPTLLLSTSTQMLELAGWLANTYSNPEYRISQLGTELSKLTPEMQQAVIQLDLSTVVGAEFTPNNTGSQIARSVQIIGMDHEISPSTHRVTLSFTDVDQRQYFVLDDIELGVLDTDLLAF
jgi:hypothetical protein